MTMLRRFGILGCLILAVSGLLAGFAAPCRGQSAPFGPGVNAVATGSRWAPTGPLNISRSGHTATSLNNGKVLVTGGANEAGVIDSAELYDPVTGAWSITGSLSAARILHTATLLPDGRVLVVGGVNFPRNYVPDFAEVYDPGTGSWSRTRPIAGRWEHTATLLQNGKVLVAGGWVDTSDYRTVIYDPATDAWSTTDPLLFGRALHSATLLPDGRVLVTGGVNDPDESNRLDVSEIYDPVTGKWSAPAGNMPRAGHTATLLQNGMVLVAGDISVAELFDPGTGQWRTTGQLTNVFYAHTATLLPDGKVLVVGGVSNLALPSAEIYDPITFKWTYANSPSNPRASHTATLLPSGNVLVAGGCCVGPVGIPNVGAHRTSELYGAFADNSFRVTALFSDRAGFFQNIQLTELSGLNGQDHFSGRTLTVTTRNGVVKQFTFPHDLPDSQTSNRAVLIGTQYGGSTDDNLDFVIPPGFLPTDGGTINFDGLDIWVFGSLPTDGWTIMVRGNGPEYLQNFAGAHRYWLLYVDPVVEYYNAALDHYFMSASQPDFDVLDSGRISGWARTGHSFWAWSTRILSPFDDSPSPPPPNLFDVCRYYIPPAEGDSHFFSASAAECAAARSLFPEFVLETSSAFLATLPDPNTGICANGQVPVYRVWNARVDSNHRYTTSREVRDQMIARGYVKEGAGPDAVVMCVGAH